MIILGIDCGLTGALAALEARSGELVALHDLPVQRDRSLGWIDGPELLAMLSAIRNGRPARAYVERLHAMPRALGGVQAGISRGLTLGSLLAALSIAGIGLELVMPGVWKRALGLIAPGASDADRKRSSLNRARLLYPMADLERAKDHNRAEAILIAYWALREWRGADAA